MRSIGIFWKAQIYWQTLGVNGIRRFSVEANTSPFTSTADQSTSGRSGRVLSRSGRTVRSSEVESRPI
jgi:hypothetical protein